MTTLQKTFIGTALAIAVGTGIYEAHQASTLRSQVQTLQQEQAPLAEQIRHLQSERDGGTRQLAALRDENEQLRQNATELLRLRSEVARLKTVAQQLSQQKPDTNDQTLSEAARWKNRVNQLKQRLELAPDARIPELQFITEQDWLDAAKGKLETDADYRRALSALRGAGENKVAAMLQKALKAYMKSNQEQLPTELNQLQPYFDPPMDDAVLQRWEIASASTVKGLGLGGDVIITQKAPVDEVFDTCLGIGPNGRGATDFLSRRVADAMNPLWEAFRAAHDGQWPDDVSQLQPYAKTPEQQIALQKLMLKNSAGK